MDLDQLRDLIRILEESSLAELEIEDDSGRVRLSKMASSAAPVMQPIIAAPVAGAPAQDSAKPAEAAAPIDEGLDYITSPMPGTFYSAATPGDPAFVSPGDVVKPNQTVCIVEAMKIMNEVGARDGGVIERVLVDNGEPVEFGQPLFAIRLSA